MEQLSLLRLYVLRAMYTLMAVGLALTFWPSILSPNELSTGPSSVVRALLGAISLLAALGIRYPAQMLPLLLFELAWKVIWVLAFGVPAWRVGQLDAYGSETLVNCLMGVVLVPLVLPWRYVFQRYLRAPAEPWRWRKPARTT
ncbi:MAG: hypothetical protein IPF98_20595 [Gemmatimonadetes bacterium]|nr:hypothetical protein [Gemmatimonadota bacterium]MCC6770760.1 hypothetical protein [Gemmatimonadaceae bacterium]